MRLAVLSASLATSLIHPGLALAQEPVRLLTPQQAEVVEMGAHHRVSSRTELVPDGMGGCSMKDDASHGGTRTQR